VRPLRVAFVALEALPLLRSGASGAPGGAERQQVLLARELLALGAEVSFVTFDADRRGTAPEIADGIEIHRACAPDAGLPVVRFLYPRLTSIWGALDRAGADVYYQRCAGMLTGVVAAFARRRGRGFVFSSAHESDCDPAALMVKNPRDRALYFHGLSRADAVVAQTEEQRRLFRERLGIEAEVVRNACPRRESRPTAPGRHVLFLAATRPWKRPEWFLEIARAFPGVRFLMAGAPAPRGAHYARAIAAQASAVPNVEWAGPVPPEAAARLVRDAILLVSTSRAEGFPNTTLEAWAARRPVVSATDPDGCIAASGGGLVAPTLDGLVAAVGRALSDEEGLAAMGERGFAHAREHHDPRRCAGELLDVLLRAANRRERAGDLAVEPAP